VVIPGAAGWGKAAEASDEKGKTGTSSVSLPQGRWKKPRKIPALRTDGPDIAITNPGSRALRQ
jgi:hypothetical protein